MIKGAQTFEDAHASPVLATIEIQLLRNGAVAVRGQITDERFALQMLDTARDTVKRAHMRKKIGHGDFAVVPACDTAIGEIG